MIKIYNLGERPDANLSELEREMDVSFVGADREPNKIHLGKKVSLVCASYSQIGVYRGLNESGQYVLLPSIVSDYGFGSSSDTYRSEEERPTLVNANAVTSIGAVNDKTWNKAIGQDSLETKPRFDGLFYTD